MKTPSLFIGVVLLCLSAEGEAAIAEAIKNSGEDVAKSVWKSWVETFHKVGPKRNIVIEIHNHLDKSIQGGQTFVQWGKEVKPPPTQIESRSQESILFEPRQGVPSGVAGILSYDIGTKDDPVRITIVFSVPLSYIGSNNWFGLEFICDLADVDKYLYTKILNSPKWDTHEEKRKYGYAKDRKPLEVTRKDYFVKATMSNQGRSILRVDIMKRP